MMQSKVSAPDSEKSDLSSSITSEKREMIEKMTPEERDAYYSKNMKNRKMMAKQKKHKRKWYHDYHVILLSLTSNHLDSLNHKHQIEMRWDYCLTVPISFHQKCFISIPLCWYFYHSSNLLFLHVCVFSSFILDCVQFYISIFILVCASMFFYLIILTSLFLYLENVLLQFTIYLDCKSFLFFPWVLLSINHSSFSSIHDAQLLFFTQI